MKNQFEKRFSDVKEQQSKNIIDSVKNDPELTMVWLSSLTDLEQKISSAIYQLNKAVTIKEVMDYFEKVTELSPPANQSGDKFKHAIVYYFPFPVSFNISEDLIMDRVKNAKEGDNIEINKKEIIENFPSFRRVERTIRGLIEINVLLERNLAIDKSKRENKKIKGLFFLNPVVRYQLDRIRDKKIAEHNKQT
jgi:hypothetical protein